jgi:hypothetical protein
MVAELVCARAHTVLGFWVSGVGVALAGGLGKGSCGEMMISWRSRDGCGGDARVRSRYDEQIFAKMIYALRAGNQKWNQLAARHALLWVRTTELESSRHLFACVVYCCRSVFALG